MPLRTKPTRISASPLGNVASILKVFRYLGAYPLTVSLPSSGDPLDITLSHSPWRTAVQCLVLLLLGWSQNLLLTPVFIRHPSLAFSVLMSLPGITNFDLAVIFTIPLFSLVSVGFILTFTAKNRGELASLSRALTQLSGHCNTNKISEASKRSALYQWKVFFGLGMCTSVCLLSHSYNAYVPLFSDMEPVLTYLALAAVPLTVNCAVLNPIINVGFFNVSYFVQYLSGHFTNLAARFEATAKTGLNGKNKVAIIAFGKARVGPADSGLHDDDDFDALLEIGLSLCDVGKQVDRVFGPTMFVIFVQNILICIAALFATSGLLFGESINWSMVAFCATYFCVVLVYALMVNYACNMGQGLESARLEVRARLEQSVAVSAARLTGRQKFKAEILAGRLEAFGTFRPLAYFEMNHPTNLSGIHTMVTYLIVLMQFKVSGSG